MPRSLKERHLPGVCDGFWLGEPSCDQGSKLIGGALAQAGISAGEGKSRPSRGAGEDGGNAVGLDVHNENICGTYESDQ